MLLTLLRWKAVAAQAVDGPWRLLGTEYPKARRRPKPALPSFPEMPAEVVAPPAAPRIETLELPGLRVVLDAGSEFREQILGELAEPVPARTRRRRKAANDDELAIALLLAA